MNSTPDPKPWFGQNPSLVMTMKILLTVVKIRGIVFMLNIPNMTQENSYAEIIFVLPQWGGEAMIR